MKILISFAFLLSSFQVQAALSKKKYEGVDNYGNPCYIFVKDIDNANGSVKDQKIHVQLNYLPQDLSMIHAAELRVSGPFYDSSIFSVIVPFTEPTQGYPYEYTASLKVDENATPLLLSFFDNSGTGYKRRNFQCTLNP